MNRQVNRIEIKGFKSIRDAALELRRLNLMIGANGAGKSNLIAAFGLLSQIVAGRFQAHVARKGGASAFLHHGPKHTKAIGLKIDWLDRLEALAK